MLSQDYPRLEVILDLGLFGTHTSIVVYQPGDYGQDLDHIIHGVYVQIGPRLVNMISLVSPEGFESIGALLEPDLMADGEELVVPYAIDPFATNPQG